jgi:hypothetical protein
MVANYHHSFRAPRNFQHGFFGRGYFGGTYKAREGPALSSLPVGRGQKPKDKTPCVRQSIFKETELGGREKI